MKPDEILKYFNVWSYLLVIFLSHKIDFSLETWYFHTYDNKIWADIMDGVMWVVFYLTAITLYGVVAQPG